MEEKVVQQQSQEVASRGGSGGKILGLIAIVIAIIALVIALSNVGVKEQVSLLQKKAEELEKKEATLEERTSALEAKALEASILSCLDRIYVLTMVERNYKLAAVELAKLEGLYAKVRGSMDKEKVAVVDKALSSLKAEINRGPSPIPELVSQLRSAFVTAVKFVPAPETEKKQEKKVEKVEKRVEKKAEVKKTEISAKIEISGIKVLFY
jgi:hypothetical protein